MNDMVDWQFPARTMFMNTVKAKRYENTFNYEILFFRTFNIVTCVL